MPIKRKITAQELPMVDTSPSYKNEAREFLIDAPDGSGWSLEHSFRGEYNIFHVWKKGDTNYDNDYENCWSSVADDIDNDVVGGGAKFTIDILSAESEKSIEGAFLPFETFIHGGSLFWEGDNSPKSVTLEVVGAPTDLVSGTTVDVDNDGKIFFVGQSNGNYDLGTNVCIIDNKTNSGHWDYIDYQLLPNMNNEGKYDLYNKEIVVAKLINSFDLLPSSHGSKTIESGNAWKVLPHYKFRLRVHDNSSNCKVSLMFHMIKRKTVSY